MANGQPLSMLRSVRKTGRTVPMVSVVIVTYNAADTLQECLNSIYRQSYSSIEIIIIDGLSRDGTVAILQENSDRIAFWKSEEDGGIYDAMNKALDHLQGDWICFLGADDTLLPGFSDLAAELKSASVIYYGNVIYRGEVCSGQLTPYFIAKKGMHHQSMFYPASVFEKHRYNTNYRISADSVLNMECWKDPDYTFEFREHTVAVFNDTGISATQKDPLLEKNMSSLILQYFGVKIWMRYLIRRFKLLFK